MTKAIPDSDYRWRCAHCGNLTRFDVIRRQKTTQFWHLDLSGEPSIDSEQVDEDIIEVIRCRWCSRDDAIEVVERPGPGDPLPEETLGGNP